MVLHKKNGFFIQKISGKEQRETQIRLCLPWTYWDSGMAILSVYIFLKWVIKKAKEHQEYQ